MSFEMTLERHNGLPDVAENILAATGNARLTTISLDNLKDSYHKTSVADS